MVDEVTREWRGMHSEELQNLLSSPNVIRMIKEGEKAGPVACVCVHTKLRLESLKGSDHSEDSGVDGRIILN
jgi:hypothetical protein